MKQTYTLIINDDSTDQLEIAADITHILNDEFDVISVNPAPATTLHEPPPTDKNKP